MSIADLAYEISEVTGRDWNPRTIRRDLHLLEFLGVVDVDEDHCNWHGCDLMDTPAAVQPALFAAAAASQIGRMVDAVVLPGIADVIRQRSGPGGVE
ncbi:hypothetical protein [Anatilimnocola floriformis]|uniref:hypothetical protein n=1 Tax=Anatilimnocola floriformis TaxID=2948575 RepID=UPI0020C2F3AE|nr:hypothetical protein [Anatilimnocola floriformis]